MLKWLYNFRTYLFVIKTEAHLKLNKPVKREHNIFFYNFVFLFFFRKFRVPSLLNPEVMNFYSEIWTIGKLEGVFWDGAVIGSCCYHLMEFRIFFFFFNGFPAITNSFPPPLSLSHTHAHARSYFTFSISFISFFSPSLSFPIYLFSLFNSLISSQLFICERQEISCLYYTILQIGSNPFTDNNGGEAGLIHY